MKNLTLFTLTCFSCYTKYITHNVKVQIVVFTVFALSRRIFKQGFLKMMFLNSKFLWPFINVLTFFPRLPGAQDNAENIILGFWTTFWLQKLNIPEPMRHFDRESLQKSKI